MASKGFNFAHGLKVIFARRRERAWDAEEVRHTSYVDYVTSC